MNYQGARERLVADDITVDELISIAAQFPGLWPEIADHPLASADLVALILTGPASSSAMSSSMRPSTVRASASNSFRRGLLTLLAIFVVAMVLLSLILSATIKPNPAKTSSGPAAAVTSVSVYQHQGSSR